MTPSELAKKTVSMIMTAVQGGTPEEAAMRNMADRLDISDVLPDIDTTGWSYESREKLKEYCKAIKWSSLDTRHDLKLSFPPSDYSKTNDPVSLTYESCYKAVGYYTSIINDIPELKNAFIDLNHYFLIYFYINHKVIHFYYQVYQFYLRVPSYLF